MRVLEAKICAINVDDDRLLTFYYYTNEMRNKKKIRDGYKKYICYEVGDTNI